MGKHAIAPPKYARVIWKSGTIHFEGEASSRTFPPESSFAGAHSCNGLNDLSNSQRLRFVIGPHVPTLAQDSLIRLGIAAERGLCPAIYGKANKNTYVHLNIVNRKTTQYKVPRSITKEELEYLHSKLKGIPSESESELNELLGKEIPSPLKRLLFGIHQPLESLGFQEDD